MKLRECIELLLAAGYFRARIKGLSSFDKVAESCVCAHMVCARIELLYGVLLLVLQIIGGLTWCIQASNFDVDVDLLFQENSTIGQKM